MERRQALERASPSGPLNATDQPQESAQSLNQAQLGYPVSFTLEQDCSMTSDEFAALANFSIGALTAVVDADWTTRAGVLEWSCWQTVDHMVDCIFSYALQIGARAQSG
jgi:hypothetical protein